MKKLSILGICLTFAFPLLPVHAGPIIMSHSGEDRVQVIELFSSESCSSCPPADDWISSLKDKPDLFKTFVPVVFHVDYWNHLNWKDGLSSDLMTKRQVDLSKQWPKPAVYTPGVVLNGNEWQKWRTSDLPKAKEKAPFEISLSKDADFEFVTEVKFGSTVLQKKKYIVRIAILGMGLETKVTSGENGGRHLRHNFVVLDWLSQPLADSRKNRLKFKKPTQKSNQLAIVTWLEEDGNLTPLQATGAYL